MINIGKCPKCEKMISSVSIEHVDVKEGVIGPASWHGISYLCPYCRSVLSAQIDPIALKADIVSELLDRLQKG